MKSKTISIISSGYNVVWAVYTIHYLILFSILSSDAFSAIAARNTWGYVLSLNIVMNFISIILAVIGVLFAHQAAKSNGRYWTTANRIIHGLMILWIISGSLWVLVLMV